MSNLQLSWPTADLEQALAAVWPGLAVEVMPQTGSTNTMLMERARAGCRNPVLLVAERQTAGCGRIERRIAFCYEHENEGRGALDSLPVDG